MKTVELQYKTARMIAHRGVSGLETENTCAAFVAAGNRSYWGIETDVHVTADGGFAVIHDDRTGRVSPTDLNVEKSTVEELAKVRLYDAHAIPRKATRSDLTIPTLQDYISVCRYYGKKAVLELKNPMTEENLRKIAAVIGEHGYLDDTVFISFCFENLLILRRLLPEQSMQFLTGEWSKQRVDELAQLHMDLDIHMGALNRERVAYAHEMGVAVNCWTCDDEKIAQALMEMGVDYITSNILE